MQSYHAYPNVEENSSNDMLFQKKPERPRIFTFHFWTSTEIYWQRRASPNTWLPRSSHITPPDFFFWDHIKGTVYVPPLSNTLPELPERKRAGAPTVTPAMLTNVPTAI